MKRSSLDVPGDAALGRPHVGDDAVRAGRRERLVDEGGQGADGRAGEHGVDRPGCVGAPAHGILHRPGCAPDRATFERALEHGAVRIEAGDLSAAGPGGHPDGPPDQADTEDRLYATELPCQQAPPPPRPCAGHSAKSSVKTICCGPSQIALVRARMTFHTMRCTQSQRRRSLLARS